MPAKRITHFMQLMAKQSHLYRPSSFWQQASEKMANEFAQHGFSHFRQQPLPLGYFVPTYGYPGHGLSQSQCEKILEITKGLDVTKKQADTIQQLISGETQALADYRVLQAYLFSNQTADLVEQPLALQLDKFSESDVGAPVEQFDFDGHKYSRSSLNYLLGLAFASQFINFQNVNTVLEIGGGFGTLGEILHSASSHIRYIDVDIPPTLLAAEYYLCHSLLQKSAEESDKNEAESLTASLDSLVQQEYVDINQLNRLTLLPSWDIEKLQGKIDLFVNFISFQEMEPEIVENYFYHVNRLNADWILLRNMREGKQKKTETSVGVETPILKESYISMLPAFELVGSNVIPFGFKTVDGYHSELLLFRRKSLN